MSTYPGRRADRDHAERLLNGTVADSHDELVRLLAAASVPAHPHELAGEEAALNAFRAQRAGLTRQPPSRASVRTISARFVTVKVAIGAAVAIGATGSVALAATTGALPGPLGSAIRAHVPPPQPATARPSTAVANPATESPSLSASPSLRELCQAYVADAGENHGTLLDTLPFEVLVSAAGGKNTVPAYCDALLAVEGNGDQVPSAASTPVHPTGKPPDLTPKPTHPTPAHPTGKPDEPPGGPPTSKPTPSQGGPVDKQASVLPTSNHNPAD
jgi:hypothetical protein